MKVDRETFLGYSCLRLSNGQLSAWLTEDFGLRLIGLALPDGESILAYLPEARIEIEGQQDYRLRGGHRLWYGPEVPATTYLPDDDPVASQIEADYVEQRQPIEDSTGIEKWWRVSLAANAARLEISHRLTNQGDTPVTLAPWAITMLKPGGLGIFPLQVEASDPHGLQPNRHLVLWPYTPVQSEFIQLRDDAVFLQAAMRSDALKIGFPNPKGWLAYLLDDLVLTKSTKFDPAAEYIDRGASSQVYCSPDVIELETLGPEVQLAPGETVEHEETWELSLAHDCRPEVWSLYQKYQAELA